MRASKPEKTNAMRALERQAVPYAAYTYPPHTDGAPAAADAMGVPREQVYKTLVVLPEPLAGAQPFLVMLRGDYDLSLRKLAAVTGLKSCRMATKKEAESLTGLETGGIGALALLDRRFWCVLDSDARSHARIWVNGGRRGLNLEVSVTDLVRLIGCSVADVLGGPIA